MTPDVKFANGMHLDEFEKKCRAIQEYSCLESEDWDKVIEIGKQICSEIYKESVSSLNNSEIDFENLNI